MGLWEDARSTPQIPNQIVHTNEPSLKLDHVCSPNRRIAGTALPVVQTTTTHHSCWETTQHSNKMARRAHATATCLATTTAAALLVLLSLCLCSIAAAAAAAPEAADACVALFNGRRRLTQAEQQGVAAQLPATTSSSTFCPAILWTYTGTGNTMTR
jgi:hypothetical protein